MSTNRPDDDHQPSYNVAGQRRRQGSGTLQDGADIVANLTGDGQGASQAQDAVSAALMMVIGIPRTGPGPDPNQLPGLTPGTPAMPGTPAYAAAERFAALPASVRHAWLAAHLAALRAGQITLGQLP